MRNFQIAGRLGNDPELKTKDDTSWTRLRVATNDGRYTHWFWVTAFGKLAEAMVEKLATGDAVAITGDLRVSTHNDKERVELIAQQADFFYKNR